MSKNTTRHQFHAIIATAVGSFLAQSAAIAADSKEAKKEPSAKASPASGHCVHSCSGYATCKGNGNNSCKGKNDCANTGLVPKECSSKATEDACAKVLDTKKEKMCTWYAK